MRRRIGSGLLAGARQMALLAVTLWAMAGCAASGGGDGCPEGEELGDDDQCHPRCGSGDVCPDCTGCREGLCYADDSCDPVCGNGDLEADEECDDGNTTLEACPVGNPNCTVCGPLCTLVTGMSASCGDHTVGAGEECDDGNTTTEACAYGETSCTVCDDTCHEVAGATSYCGDGVYDAANGEACDDGNGGTGDGCNATCQVEAGWGCDTSTDPSVCAEVPDPPVIDGEPSAGHDSPTWTWSAPQHAVSYRYRLDGGAWTSTATRVHTASGLAAGSHTFEVVACNADDGCSTAASFVTVIEYLGQGYPGLWQGVAKSDLTTTALGNVAPISCHNCYNGPSNQVYDTAAALAKINLAVSRGGDLIELDIAEAGGTLCVYHGDPSSCASYPPLSAILADATLRAADALLFVEIKEGNQTPAAFAMALLDLLDANRDVVKNGRPLILRAFAGGRDYLLAIQAAAPSYPMIEHYLRYSILYGRTTTAVAVLQSEFAADIAGPGFHMVELNYQQPNFAGLAKYAQSLGLAVGVWTIPGSFGEVFLAALREEVDQLTAEYRIDQARLVVEETNTYAYVNASGCGSAADPTVAIRRNHSGTVINDSFTANQAATGSLHGTPALHYQVVGEDRFGCSLNHRTVDSLTDRAVDLGEHAPMASTGYLVTAIVNFDNHTTLNGTRAILNSSQAGGVALELVGDGSTVTLRFGVHVGSGYSYHGYNVSSTGLSNNASLNGTNSYLLVGAYDGDGGIYLWVDNEKGGGHSTASGSVTSSGQPFLIGADPEPGEALKARFFFDGFIQQAMVLRWGSHAFSGDLVN